MCHIAAARETNSQAEMGSELFMDLIPDSVAKLSLVAEGEDRLAEALDALVCRFCDRKPSSSELRKLDIYRPYTAGKVYKAACDRVVEVVRDCDKDVVVELQSL
jgi:hypothetical protein